VIIFSSITIYRNQENTENNWLSFIIQESPLQVPLTRYQGLYHWRSGLTQQPQWRIGWQVQSTVNRWRLHYSWLPDKPPKLLRARLDLGRRIPVTSRFTLQLLQQLVISSELRMRIVQPWQCVCVGVKYNIVCQKNFDRHNVWQKQCKFFNRQFF